MLKRKVLEPVRLVLPFDSAIDHGRSDYDAYKSTWDTKHLVYVEGGQPSVFVINQLTHRQRQRVANVEHIADRASLAIRYGLISVENYAIEKPDGSVVFLEQPRRTHHGDLGECITEDWMEQARFLTDELVTIGGAIMSISEARAPLS